MQTIHTVLQTLGGSSLQAMFHYVAVLGKKKKKKNHWENKPELAELHVILFLLMLLQPEGDTSLELLNNNMKNHLIVPLMKCGNFVKKINK